MAGVLFGLLLICGQCLQTLMQHVEFGVWYTSRHASSWPMIPAFCCLRSQLQAAKAAIDLAQHQEKIEQADAALKERAQALQEQHGSAENLPELAKLQLAAMMKQR